MRVLLAAVALLAAITHAHDVARRQATTPPRRVVCYYTNWSVYRKGLAKYTPQNINPYLCTHLVYAFGGLTDEFEVKPFDSYQDIEQGGYAKFNGLKQYNKGLKTLLAIGGWNEGSGRFSELVSLPELRKTFILSAIKHLRRYNFDGLDLDWEYPASRDGSAPEDRENYALLVSELRAAFEDEGRKVKSGRLLLTMAVPAGQNYIDKGYDVPSLTRDLDFINILNYDYHSAYEPSVNHHAALLPAPGTSEYAWNAQLNVDWTVKYYIELGADADKLVIGIPTYGRSYTLIDGNFTDFGASADGPGEQGKYTKEKGFMAFYEVCENIASHGWSVRKPFPRRIGPYAYAGNQWVGYDDEKIVARKAEYVRENGLGGIMYWSLDNDDFRGICNGEQYPLVEAGKKALFGTDGDDVDETLNEARSLQKAPAPAQQVPEPPTKDTETRRRRPVRPRVRPTTTTTTTTARPRSRTRPRTQDTQAPSRTRSRFGAPGERTRRPASLSSRIKNRQRTTTTTTTPRPSPAATRAPSRVDPSKRRRPGARRRPGSKRRPAFTTTIDPLNTPAPPTTPSPVSSFACRREGFFPNPDDCHKYYWCLNSGASGLGIVAHTFTCPSDLVFSRTIDGCDHPSRAKCNTNKRNRGGAGVTTPGPTTPIPTTTEIPVDYSYLDDYYQDDEYYYYDYEDELPVEESPDTETSRQFQNSGGSQFSRDETAVEPDYPAAQEDTAGTRGLGARTRPQYSTITRDRTKAAAAEEEPATPDRQDPRDGGRVRPQYTSITRERPEAPAETEQQASEPREGDAVVGGRREYTTIERQRPATQSRPEQQESEADQADPSPGRRQYSTIERQRPAAQSRPAQEDVATQEADSAPGRRQYSTIERQRPATQRRPVQESEPREATDPSTGELEYVTIQRERPATPASPRDQPVTEEQPEVTTEPVEEVTKPLPRIRVPTSRPRPPPTPPRNFFRSRSTTTTAAPETLPTEPRQRVTRPPRISAEITTPILPVEEEPITFPATEAPEATPPAPGTPASSTLPVPSEDEYVDYEYYDYEYDTTLVPGTSENPSLFSLFTITPTTPADTTPAPTTPAPTTVPPKPRVTLRPFRPRPRPASTPRKPPQPQPKPTKPAPTPRPALRTTTPPKTTSRPVVSRTRAPFSKIPERPAAGGPPASSILDGQDYYDYYYDDLDGALTGTLGDLASLTDKAVLLSDGSVQCYDTGYFAHPSSCKKFISCSKTVRGIVRGWVYTCPQNLVFDPVGGMCNWAEAVDCQ